MVLSIFCSLCSENQTKKEMQQTRRPWVTTVEGLRSVVPCNISTESSLFNLMGSPPLVVSVYGKKCVWLVNAGVAAKQHMKVVHHMEEMDVVVVRVYGKDCSPDGVFVEEAKDKSIAPIPCLSIKDLFSLPANIVVHVDVRNMQVDAVQTLIVERGSIGNFFFGWVRLGLSLPVCPELVGNLVLVGGRPLGMYTYESNQSFVVPFDAIARCVQARHKQGMYLNRRPVLERRLPYLDVAAVDAVLVVLDTNLSAQIITEMVSLETASRLVIRSEEESRVELLDVPPFVDTTTEPQTKYRTHSCVFLNAYPYALFWGLVDNECSVVALFAEGVLTNFSRVGKKTTLLGPPDPETVRKQYESGRLRTLHTTQLGLELSVWPKDLSPVQLVTSSPADVGHTTLKKWSFIRGAGGDGA